MIDGETKTLPTAAQLSRRHFLQASVTVAAGASAGLPLLLDAGEPEARGAKSSAVLRGFVVSDAHFGWAAREQPAVEKSRAVMQAIMRRFPNLDVFIDTGDATHSYGTDLDRANWLQTIQGGCGLLPFHFAAGNHDLAGPWYPMDPEQHVQTLGSLPCRPYYSFDLKNIHFVILPQLHVVSIVTHESLEWLKLDLELNKGKTTIVFSHNSLIGTTFKPEPGLDNTYRLVANSEEVYQVFRAFPDVKAWMHGHNHDFVVVRKENMLHVSNGRIGGFDPHRNTPLANCLGGFLLEVSSSRISVRAYDGAADRFLDELPEGRSLHQHIETQTSLDASVPPSVCFGAGNCPDGQMWPVYSHYISAPGAKTSVSVKAAGGAILNDDPSLACYLEGWRGEESPAYSIRPGRNRAEARPKGDGRQPPAWLHAAPGIRLLKAPETSASRSVRSPAGRGARSYWKCSPGRTYRLVVDFDCDAAGPSVQLAAQIFGPDNTTIAKFDSGAFESLAAGSSQRTLEFTVPESSPIRSIYTDSESDLAPRVSVEALVKNPVSDVLVRRFVLSPMAGKGSGGAIELAGGKYAAGLDSISTHEHMKALAGRETCSISAPDGASVSWCLRKEGLVFQVRNGIVEDQGDFIRIVRLRERFSLAQEIIFAPLADIRHPFVHRLRHIERARIARWDPGEKAIRIEIEQAFGIAEIDVCAAEKPKQVTGAEMWNDKDGMLTIWTTAKAPVEIRF